MVHRSIMHPHPQSSKLKRITWRVITLPFRAALTFLFLVCIPLVLCVAAIYNWVFETGDDAVNWVDDTLEWLWDTKL